MKNEEHSKFFCVPRFDKEDKKTKEVYIVVRNTHMNTHTSSESLLQQKHQLPSSISEMNNFFSWFQFDATKTVASPSGSRNVAVVVNHVTSTNIDGNVKDELRDFRTFVHQMQLNSLRRHSTPESGLLAAVKQPTLQPCIVTTQTKQAFGKSPVKKASSSFKVIHSRHMKPRNCSKSSTHALYSECDNNDNQQSQTTTVKSMTSKVSTSTIPRTIGRLAITGWPIVVHVPKILKSKILKSKILKSKILIQTSKKKKEKKKHKK